MPTTDITNSQCPAFDSHEMNAADLLFPGVSILTPEQSELVDIAAVAEYLACEGH